MNPIFRSASALSAVLLLSLVAALLTCSASAQGCGLRNRYRIANSYSGIGSELSVDTGWVTTALLGQNQNYGVTSAPTNQPVFFAYSLGNPVSVPIGGCVITEDPTAAALLLVGQSDAAGVCNFSLSLPPSPGLNGVSLTAQALVLSPGGPLFGFAELSNGVFSTIGS